MSSLATADLRRSAPANLVLKLHNRKVAAVP